MRNAQRSDNAVGNGRITAVAVVFAAACLLGSAPARAAGGYWTVAAVDGAAVIFPEPAAGHVAIRGYRVVDGATIHTGADGTILLVRRDDSIMIYPNSEVTLPRAPSDRRPDVVQMSGDVLYRMRTPEAWSFGVRTPYFAATAGKTVFTISVAADRATVSVAKGIARIAAIRGGQSNIIRAGDRVSVIAGSADHVVLDSVNPGDPSFWGAGAVGSGPPPGPSGTAGSPGDASGRSGSKGGGPDGGDDSKGGSPDGGDDSKGGGPDGGDDSKGGGPDGGDDSKGGGHGGDSKGDGADGGDDSKGGGHGGGASKGGGSNGNRR